MKETYQVDGVDFEDAQEAFDTAVRLHQDAEGARTITVYTVDHYGEKQEMFSMLSESEEESMQNGEDSYVVLP